MTVDDFREALLSDEPQQVLEPRLAALLDYARKLTTSPSSCRREDVQSLRDAGATDSDECRTVDLGMPIEDRLARNRVHCIAASADSMRFPATKPKAVAIVEIADVADSVPEEFAVRNLCKCVLICASYVFGRHNRASHDDLADFANG